MRKRFGAALAALVLLAGCAGQQGYTGPKQGVGAGLGAIGGAVAGGLLGNKLGGGGKNAFAIGAGAALGAIGGGFLGAGVGESLDRMDEMARQQAVQQALLAPAPTSVPWSNPQTGHSGRITTYDGDYGADGRFCRDYSQIVSIGGRNQEMTGRACQNADGSWSQAN